MGKMPTSLRHEQQQLLYGFFYHHLRQAVMQLPCEHEGVVHLHALTWLRQDHKCTGDSLLRHSWSAAAPSLLL